MKKAVSFFLAVCLLIGLFSASALNVGAAAGGSVGDCRWELNGTERKYGLLRGMAVGKAYHQGDGGRRRCDYRNERVHRMPGFKAGCFAGNIKDY